MIHGEAERIARALEAKNTYDQSKKGQKDAHDAAQAAGEAAGWAQAMFWIGLAETMITAGGVVLVFFTLFEARRAANEAKRSADAATRQLESVWAAERAYIGTQVHAQQDLNGDFLLVVANTGRTTAHILEVHWNAADKLPADARLRNTLLLKAESDLTLAGAPPDPVIAATLGPIYTSAQYIYGYVRYVDVYRRFQRTHFRYDSEGNGSWKSAGGVRWNRAR